MRVDVGRLSDVPSDRCIAIADGAAVVIRVEDRVVAFQNRCLHQNSPLAEGRIFGDTLTCPLHFWRYRIPSGEHVGGEGDLTAYPVFIEHGRVSVEIPDPAPQQSMRETLLQHAREWKRDE